MRRVSIRAKGFKPARRKPIDEETAMRAAAMLADRIHDAVGAYALYDDKRSFCNNLRDVHRDLSELITNFSNPLF